MTALLNKLHARLGDFWWYSLMIFCACRVADVMNVFVGLWIVPKYIDPAELGAVMPLTQFANFLAAPVAILATVFMKEVNTLATRGEFGQMKTLIRGVFVSAGVFLVLALIATRLLMPMFLERIRIAEGSLGILVIASAFIGCTAPIYQNALQALKKFKAISLMNIAGAPLRLVTMLIAMPFRPLSGYFVGQAITPAFNICTSIVALRKELAAKAERYWSQPVVRRVGWLLIGISACHLTSLFVLLVEQTVLRQRLPDMDSAAYYMVTRFSEISSFVSGTLLMILFPFTAELAEKGKDTRPLVLKSSAALLICSGALAAFFWLFGRQVLAFLPHGESYAKYYWAIPWLIGILAISGVQGFYLNTEISAARFGFLKWYIPIHIIYVAALLLVTGHGYFEGMIPSSWSAYLSTHNIHSLSSMLWWMTGMTLVKQVFCTFFFMHPQVEHT